MNKQAKEPLAEFEDFLCVKGCTPEKQTLCFRLLGEAVLRQSSIRQEKLVAVEVGPSGLTS